MLIRSALSDAKWLIAKGGTDRAEVLNHVLGNIDDALKELDGADLLIIYGVGGTIDYLKDNKDANKIPDKCVKALDKYLDDVLTEDKDKE